MYRKNLMSIRLIWVKAFAVMVSILLLMPVFSTAKMLNEAQFKNDSISRVSDADFSVPPYSAEMARAAQFLTSNDMSDSARSLAIGAVSGKLQQWANQFGSSRISLIMDRYGNFNNSSGDLLVSIYDKNEYLLFIQGGIRNPNDRLTGNLGFGLRSFWQNGWMYGGNFFIDKDFTGHNHRIGFGAEAWRDYFRLSANSYLNTSSWHSSRDFDGTWQEKPSNGFDLRTEAWIPAYPQLGGKLVFEQYYGNKVAIFNKDSLERNPYIVTAGATYTPVPLITFGVNQKYSRSNHDTLVSMELNWLFGRDLLWQLDSQNIDSMRNLSGSKYDLVDRNNEIVLQYRKDKDLLVSTLLLSVVTDRSLADGKTYNILRAKALDINGKPVANALINWNVSPNQNVTLATTSSTTNDYGIATIMLSSSIAQTVLVTAQNGKAIASKNSNFIPLVVDKLRVSVIQDGALANEKDINIVEALLTDANEKPISGQTVEWIIPRGVLLKGSNTESDHEGKVTIHLASSIAAKSVITAEIGSLSDSQSIHFIGDDNSAQINRLLLRTDGSLADGKAKNIAEAIVTDAKGNKLAGQIITWSSDSPTTVFGKSEPTDDNGITTVSFSNVKAGTIKLTASLLNGNQATVPSLFVADDNFMKLNLSVTSGAIASGVDTNEAEVLVTDKNDNAITNTPVTFSITGNAKLDKSVVNTDNNGRALVTFSNTLAETVSLTAKLVTGVSKSKDSNFVADLNNAIFTIESTSDAWADGVDKNKVTVILTDKYNNPLPSQSITLDVTGDAKLSTTTGVTDSSGQMIATITDTTPETVTITASLVNGRKASGSASFITYFVKALTSNINIVKADGIENAVLTAIVENNLGSRVANADVLFEATGQAKLSSTLATTNSDGVASVSLTNVNVEQVTVTAKAQRNSTDIGKSQNIKFVRTVKISAVGSFGEKDGGRGRLNSFAPEDGFPKTGLNKTSMYIDITGANASDYNWQTNRSWIKVDSNILTFNWPTPGSPPKAEWDVVVTGTSKSGGDTLIYEFHLKQWYKLSSRVVRVDRENNNVVSACSDHLGKPAFINSITDGAVDSVGKLFGEWRGSEVFGDNFYFTQDSSNAWVPGQRVPIPIVYRTGEATTVTSTGVSSAVCLISER